MSQDHTTNRLSNQPLETEVSGYRLVRKPFMCHVCERDFKKMVPVNEDIEVECPQCNLTFTEELATSARSANQASSSSVSSGSNRNSGPASPVLGATQPQVSQPQVPAA